MRQRLLPGFVSEWKWDLRRIITVLILLVVCLVWVYPFLWMVSASLKTSREIFASGLNLVPSEWRWENYERAWVQANFSRYMINTVVITVATVALVVFHTSLSGYVLGRFKFIGQRFILGLLVATVFVPLGYTIIPTVQIAGALGLLNTLLGPILVLSSGHVIHILLFAAFFRSVPKELEEAAVLDGANFLQVYWRVMLPLSRPVIATVSVLTFLQAWNNFLVPLVFTFSRPDLRTLSVGLFAFIGENEIDWSGMAAAATLSLIPIVLVFFFAQRQFVEGLAGAVKQ
ncbi:MAG: carbohydrate ABC transporter permease [Chloroflexota bacterium]|nr:MAG: sugar permease [Chloroflexota bacterium]